MSEGGFSSRDRVADLLARTTATGDLYRSIRRDYRRWQHVLDFEEYQELVLERIWVHADQFRGQNVAEFLGWIKVIGWNVALDRWRHKTRQDRLLKQVAASPPPSHPPFTQQVETQDLVQWLLAGLSESERQVIRWRYFEGKSPQDLADILGISMGAVHQAHHRAIEKLRQRLARQKKNS